MTRMLGQFLERRERSRRGNAWRNLEKLIAAYRRPEQGYLSRYAPVREAELGGVYDHLARVREWSTGAEEGGADE